MKKPIPFPGSYRGSEEGVERSEVTGMFPVARLSLRAGSGPLKGKRFEFDGGPFVIGRAPTCTVSIPSEGVSRVHARIEYGNGGYWLIPEKTVNGTRVNDVLVHQLTQLSEGDRITVHDTTFVVVYGSDADAEAELEAMAQAAQAAARSAVPPHRATDGSGFAVAKTPVPTTRGLAGIPGSAYPDPALDALSFRADTVPIAEARAPAPTRRIRWPLWIAGGMSFVVVIIGIVVLTIRLVAPRTAPVASTTAPAVSPPPPPTANPPPATAVRATGPTPAAGSATPATGSAAPAAAIRAPTPGGGVNPPPSIPGPATDSVKHDGVLELVVTKIVTDTPGSVVDVAAAGALIERDAAIVHLRLASAESDAKRKALRDLERQFGDSPDHADFIAQARREYVKARNLREVRPIVASVRGAVTRIAVKPNDSVAKDDVIAELTTARFVFPAAAMEGTGNNCAIDLVNGGKSLSGRLLDPTATDKRIIELDRVPDDLAPGAFGVSRVRCTAR